MGRAQLLLFCFLGLSVGYGRVIHISPAGEDSEKCLSNSSTSCQTLDWVFQRSEARLSSTHFLLSGGTHYIAEPSTPFQDLEDIAFSGTNSVIECTQPGTGLAFVNVSGLSFEGVSFHFCSAIRNSTSHDFVKNSTSLFKVALYFYNCKDISMSSVDVSHSPNATGIVIYNSDGANSFTNCNFTKNTFVNSFKENSSLIDNSTFPGGGGFYVEFTYCEPGETCTSPVQHKNSGATYTFSSCTFSDNIADNLDTQDRSTYIVPHGIDHEAFGRGGGLSIFLKGDAHNISITVEECMFDGNRALWGAGMFLELHDSVWANVITVRSTIFKNNWCPYSLSQGTGGGGMRIGLYVYQQAAPSLDPKSKNSIIVMASTFTNNSALHGGGLSISPALQNTTSLNAVAQIDLIVVTFESNIAKLGAALDVDRFGDILVGLMVMVRVASCTFRNNSIKYAQLIGKGDTPYELGLGAVHIDAVAVYFIYTATFEDNYGSAIAATGTTVSFGNCSATFHRNRGKKGAAIALHGAANIQIGEKTSMWFENNTASTKGGAIYNMFIERENLKSDSNCFIHHRNAFLNADDWKVNITFLNNTDNGGIHYNAIHSTSILPCSVPGGSGIINDETKIFCWEGWEYPDGNCSSAITSDIGVLTLDKGNNISVYPGWEFDLPVDIQDDLNNPIKGQSFTVEYSDTKDYVVASKESVQVDGNPNEVINITLESLEERAWHFKLSVTLRECPPGFVTNSNLSGIVQCTCADNQFGGAILCDDSSHNINLLNGMWMGKLNESLHQYYVMACPLNYCNKENSRYRMFDFRQSVTGQYDNNKYLVTEICGAENRAGINCATCMEGFGVAINSASFDCISCTDINLGSNIAKYVAAVYLPLALLFSVLIVFDIRLTTGPANAFILYCQVVSSTFDLNADGGVPHSNVVLKAYRFPFGIFNLEFIEDYISPICFSQSFNTLQVFLMQYAVALFPLVMILVVIACLKISETCCLKNQRLGESQRRVFISISRLASLLSRNKRKNINDALLPAFASFLLLSYTKFSTISSFILNTQHPVDENGTQIDPARVYYAAQYEVTDPAYLYYKIPAIVVFSTIVIFLPLVLLDYPLKMIEWVIIRVQCLRKIYSMDKIHLFMNMFQGCYRDKMRFFAGLYFLFRFTINLSYIATDTWLQQFLVQQTATTIMIALLALFHPYKKKYLNYVDILIFTNLAVLNSISFYLYSFTKIDPNMAPRTEVLNLQYILVFLPLAYMIGYLLWNITRKYHEIIKKKFKRFISKLTKKGYEPIDDTDSDEVSHVPSILSRPPPRSFLDREREFESDFDAMLSRAEDTNTYMPSMSKSMSVVEVDGRHGEGEAIVTQTRVSADSGMRSFPVTPIPEEEFPSFSTNRPSK